MTMEVHERNVSPRAARSAEAWMLGREPEKTRIVMEPVKRRNSKSVLQRYPPALAAERRKAEMMQSMTTPHLLNRSKADVRARSSSPPSIRKILRQAPTPERLVSTPSDSPARILPSSSSLKDSQLHLSYASQSPPVSPLRSPKSAHRSKRGISPKRSKTQQIPPQPVAKMRVRRSPDTSIPPSPLPASHVSCIKSVFSDSVDLYRDVLGVSRMASPRHLRIAYFRKGRVVLEENLTNKQQHFQALSMAYEILSNAEWKEYYDAYGLIPGRNQTKPATPKRSSSPNSRLSAAHSRISLRSSQKTESKKVPIRNSAPASKSTPPGMDEESRDAWEETRKEEEEPGSPAMSTTTTTTIAAPPKLPARTDDKRWMEEFDVGSWKNLEHEGYATSIPRSVVQSDSTVQSESVDCSEPQTQQHSKSAHDALTEEKSTPPMAVVTPTRRRHESLPPTPVSSPTILRKSASAKTSPPRNCTSPLREEDVTSVKSAESILKKQSSPGRKSNTQNRIRWNEEVEELVYQAHPDEHYPTDDDEEDELVMNPLKNFDESFVKSFWTDLEKSMDGLETSIDGWMRYWSDDALDGKIIKTNSQDSNCTENTELSRKSSEDSSKSGVEGSSELLSQSSSVVVVKKSRKLKHKSTEKPMDPEKDLEDDVTRELYAEMTKPVTKEILDQILEKKKRSKFKSFVKKQSAKKAAEEKDKSNDAIMFVETRDKWDNETISTMSASEMTPFVGQRHVLQLPKIKNVPVPVPEPNISSSVSTSTPDMGTNPLQLCTGGGVKTGCLIARGPAGKEEAASEDVDFFSYLSTYMLALKEELSKIGTHVSNLDWEKANQMVIDSITVPEDDVQGMLDVLSKEMDTEESVAMSRSYTY